jgi:hypothetical protein
VLWQANTRLTRIAAVVGGSPAAAEIDAATAIWAQAATIFNRTAALLANAIQVSPNPACPTG